MTDESGSRWKWDKTLRLFDGLLTLVSFFGLIILGYQSCELYRSNQLAVDAQRAWVGPGVMELIAWKPGDPLLIKIRVTNTGSTPALDVTALGRWARRPKDWTFTPDFKDSIERRWGVLQPQAGGDFPIIAPIQPHEMESVKRGDSIFYFWGRINYKDVTRAEPRWTTFCYLLTDSAQNITPCSNDYSDAR